MGKSFMQQSGRLSDLRETSVSLSGKWQSGAFLTALYGGAEHVPYRAMCGIDDDMDSAFVEEYVRVSESDMGEILWQAADNSDLPQHGSEYEFASSYCLYRVSNHGEFGGTLQTPQRSVSGNFAEIFELYGKVYAIDTLDHMGMGHTKIYAFDADGFGDVLFDSGYDAEITLAALTVMQDRAYILLTGSVFEPRLFQPKRRRGRKRCKRSYLFEISQNGFADIADFDCEFPCVCNMIVRDGQMILGMDKSVVTADLTSETVKTYTPLTAAAEEDIKAVTAKKDQRSD